MDTTQRPCSSHSSERRAQRREPNPMSRRARGRRQETWVSRVIRHVGGKHQPPWPRRPLAPTSPGQTPPASLLSRHCPPPASFVSRAEGRVLLHPVAGRARESPAQPGAGSGGGRATRGSPDGLSSAFGNWADQGPGGTARLGLASLPVPKKEASGEGEKSLRSWGEGACAGCPRTLGSTSTPQPQSVGSEG